MKRAVVLLVIAVCVVSALSLTEDVENLKSSATVSPAKGFGSPAKPTTTTTTTKPTTTTTTTKPTTTTTTTKPTTTTTKPTTTTTKPTTTTTKPTTTTTTTKPTTTTTKPTTTTTKPTTTTTTTKPTTTTTKPTTTTTTTKPTTTTTTKPTTTTTTKPTTTTTKPTTTTPPSPKPTPSTNVTVGTYKLMKDQKVVCLMAQMALKIRLATLKANGTFVVQPNVTKAEGYCRETKANLTLVFKEGFITFMFNKSVANNTAYVDALSFVLSYPLSKGGDVKYTASNVSMHLFAAKIGHSYSCKSESIYMGNGLYLDVGQDRMQAFNLTQSNEFGPSDHCAADWPDYRVAIAVGVTLLVLIVIVLVAYLLGRRRRTDGYQSL